jgi:hypothetical protein
MGYVDHSGCPPLIDYTLDTTACLGLPELRLGDLNEAIIHQENKYGTGVEFNVG